MTRNMIRDFFKWTQFSIIQQSLVISVQNVSPPATAFVSFCHRSRMCQLNEVDELVVKNGR